jgi:hypothetical protein
MELWNLYAPLNSSSLSIHSKRQIPEMDEEASSFGVPGQEEIDFVGRWHRPVDTLPVPNF